MFTALVLNEKSQKNLLTLLGAKGFNFSGSTIFCHHVTLAMGAHPDLVTGEPVTVRATHFGTLAGRVCAVKVEGITRKDKGTAHVTLATFGDAKPKESNEIREWQALPASIELTGTVEICD